MALILLAGFVISSKANSVEPQRFDCGWRHDLGCVADLLPVCESAIRLQNGSWGDDAAAIEHWLQAYCLEENAAAQSERLHDCYGSTLTRCAQLELEGACLWATFGSGQGRCVRKPASRGYGMKKLANELFEKSASSLTSNILLHLEYVDKSCGQITFNDDQSCGSSGVLCEWRRGACVSDGLAVIERFAPELLPYLGPHEFCMKLTSKTECTMNQQQLINSHQGGLGVGLVVLIVFTFLLVCLALIYLLYQRTPLVTKKAFKKGVAKMLNSHAH